MARAGDGGLARACYSHAVTDPLLLALLEQLVRNGTLDADDITEMADRLEAAGDEAHAHAAHLTRCALIQASAPSQSDWEADWRRRQIRERTAFLNRKPDGGNEPG